MIHIICLFQMFQNARKLDVKIIQFMQMQNIYFKTSKKEVGLVDEVATFNFMKDSLVELSKVQKPVWKKGINLRNLWINL